MRMQMVPGTDGSTKVKRRVRWRSRSVASTMRTRDCSGEMVRRTHSRTRSVDVVVTTLRAWATARRKASALMDKNMVGKGLVSHNSPHGSYGKNGSYDPSARVSAFDIGVEADDDWLAVDHGCGGLVAAGGGDDQGLAGSAGAGRFEWDFNAQDVVFDGGDH